MTIFRWSRGQLPKYSELSGLGVSGLPKSAILLNSFTEDLVNSIHRHSLVKGSIITEMVIPWLLKMFHITILNNWFTHQTFQTMKGAIKFIFEPKLEVFLAKCLKKNQQLCIGFLTDCLTTAWWLLDPCLMIFWPLPDDFLTPVWCLSNHCLTTDTGTACWLLTFIMTENCIIEAWIRKKSKIYVKRLQGYQYV